MDDKLSQKFQAQLSELQIPVMIVAVIVSGVFFIGSVVNYLTKPDDAFFW